MRASLPRLFWRQFEGALALPVHLLLLYSSKAKIETQLIHRYLISHR